MTISQPTPTRGEGFTPGPWTACKDGACRCGFIWDASGNIHVASVHDGSALGEDWFGGDIAVGPAEREANARLIAAAPCLLEALTRIAAPRDCGCRPCRGQCVSQEALAIEADEVRDIARAAISKALGAAA